MKNGWRLAPWIIGMLLIIVGFAILAVGTTNKSQDLTQQLQTREVARETLEAIVLVDIVFYTTPVRTASPGEAMRIARRITTFGTVVDTSRGIKVVIARHTIYPFANMLGTLTPLEFLTITIIDPRSQSQHAVSIEGLNEFPELDLITLDPPSSLQLKPLPLGDADFEKTPIVSHIYTADPPEPNTSAFYSQVVHISPFPSGDASAENFIKVTGRVIPGDSGSPLIMNQNGERKVVGFIGFMTNDKYGGMAVKASRLREELAKLNSQRPHE